MRVGMGFENNVLDFQEAPDGRDLTAHDGVGVFIPRKEV